MARARKSKGLSLPWWLRLTALMLTPICALNLAVAFFGSTLVFPFSPFFLREKATALATYAKHRAGCLFEGHGALSPLVDAAERKHRLPTGLLQALVEVESRGDPHRISPAGAMGPGQLMAGTAAMLGVRDPFDPAEAVDASGRYLAQQLKRFGRLDLAIAAYNAGPGAIDGRVPRNGETEFYVVKVLAAYERHRPPEPPPAVAEVRAAPVATPATAAPAVATPTVAPVLKKEPARTKLVERKSPARRPGSKAKIDLL